MKSIILYFSRAGENYMRGTIEKLDKGNTEVVAEKLAEFTGADLFEADPVHAYSVKYNTCVEEARADQRRDARPKLKNLPENIEDYDTIYVGYPNYWGTMPMPVFTLLDAIADKVEGKEIRPFCTHEGSGMGRSESDLAKLLPKAKIVKGLPLHGSSANSADKALQRWLAHLDNE